MCLVQENSVIHNFTFPIYVWTYFPLKIHSYPIHVAITLPLTNNLASRHKGLSCAPWDQVLDNGLPQVFTELGTGNFCLKLILISALPRFHFLIILSHRLSPSWKNDSCETRWKGRVEKRIQHLLWSVSNPDHTARNPVGHKNDGKYLVWWCTVSFNCFILNWKTQLNCLKRQCQQQLGDSPGNAHCTLVVPFSGVPFTSLPTQTDHLWNLDNL